ncbi:C-X-C motif chemokine 10-like isoform X2 [Engystomops pustulosus]|uniref:C-X-C motif chemokine 10-like isoform X2 n=1 Tax=Engystomops pustulosus TaxID=76066 RepID=UPI003AFA3F9C
MPGSCSCGDITATPHPRRHLRWRFPAAAAHIQRGRRCKCTGLIEQLNVKKVMRLEIFPASSTCENKEYVVVLKSSKKSFPKKCVNPNSKEVKAILKENNKKTKHIKVIRKGATTGK